MKKLLLIAGLVSLFETASIVCCGQTSTTAISGNEKDGKIVSDIMAVNMYQLALVKMAAEKATSEELREIANRIVLDHQKMDAQLTSYANRANFAIEPEKKDKYLGKIQKWDTDPAGEGWDRDIIEELIDLHKDGLDMLGNVKGLTKDGEVSETISSNIPILQAHLDMLMPLKGKIKDGQATEASTPPVGITNAAADVPQGNEKDAKFVSDIRATNSYELKLMELVFKKGNNRDLKNAAQHIIEDHQKLDTRVREYSKKHGYGIDPDEGSKINEKLVKWSQKRGGMEWDADVIEELKDVHKDGIDMLEDAVTDVKDDELQQLMKEALSQMRMHLEMLEPLKEKVKKPWNGKK
jgi:putative membrane protein